MLSPVDQIKSKLTIVELVGEYLKLEKAGVNYRARCPFHNEKTPSFFVSPSRDTFHCFGCSKGGDIFTFVEEIEGVPFREALNLLAARTGVSLKDSSEATTALSRLRKVMEAATIFYIGELAKSKVAKDYLKNRKASAESIEKFRIGVAPESWDSLHKELKKQGFAEEDMVSAGVIIASAKKPGSYYDRFRNRLMFPIMDQGGRVVAFTGRILPGGEEGSGKYVNSPETPLFQKSKVLYGLNLAKQAIREADKALFVEGQFDVVLAHQADVKNVVAASGTAMSADQLKLIRRFTDAIDFVLDGDEAGFAASDKSVRLALSQGFYVGVIAMPEGSDPADMVAEDKEKFTKLITQSEPFIDYAIKTLKARGLNSRKLQSAVRDHLYPYLHSTYNEIERDADIDKVASLLGSTKEAVHADLAKWQKTNSDDPPNKTEVAGDSPPGSSLPSNIAMVAGQIYGLLWWQKGLKEPTLKAKDLEAQMKEILGDKLYKTFESELSVKKDEHQYKAEVQYEHHEALADEKEILLRRLQAELLKYKFEKLMIALKQAELEGDTKKAEDYLKQCQSLSLKLEALKNNEN